MCAIDISSAATYVYVLAIDAPSTAGCCSAAQSLAGSRDRGMILSRLEISCSMQWESTGPGVATRIRCSSHRGAEQ